MTDPTIPQDGRKAAALDRWLADQHAALADTINALLDVEAGLREVLLPTRYAALAAELDAVLDVEAGLAAILPAPATAPATPPPSPGNRAALDRPTFAELHRLTSSIEAGGPQARLRARNNPVLRDLNLALDQVPTLIELLARARSHARALARDLDNYALDEHTRGRGRDLAIARLGGLADDLVDDLGHAHNLATEIIRGLGRDIAHTHTLALTRELNTAQTLAACTRHPDHNRDRVLDLTLDLTSDLGLAFARARDLDTSRATFDRALNDFIGLNLRGVDLTGISLEGLRWSLATMWPVDWEEEIVQASVEVAPGIFEVCGGTEQSEHTRMPVS